MLTINATGSFIAWQIIAKAVEGANGGLPIIRAHNTQISAYILFLETVTTREANRVWNLAMQRCDDLPKDQVEFWTFNGADTKQIAVVTNLAIPSGLA